jgi:hemerythrin-like metal-binding protein
MYMTWDSSMEIGHPSTDAYHKALLEHINKLVETVFVDSELGPRIRAHTMQMLAGLRSLMTAHARAEDSLMVQYEFPLLAQHRKEHQELMEQFDLFVRQFSAGANASLAHAVRFLREWFDYHDEQWDRPLAMWLKARNKGRQAIRAVLRVAR